MGQKITTTMLDCLAYNFKCQPRVCTNLRGFVHYICKLSTHAFIYKGKPCLSKDYKGYFNKGKKLIINLRL